MDISSHPRRWRNPSREPSQGGDTASNPVGTTSEKRQVRALVLNRSARCTATETPNIPQISRTGSSVASARKGARLEGGCTIDGSQHGVSVACGGGSLSGATLVSANDSWCQNLAHAERNDVRPVMPEHSLGRDRIGLPLQPVPKIVE